MKIFKEKLLNKGFNCKPSFDLLLKLSASLLYGLSLTHYQKKLGVSDFWENVFFFFILKYGFNLVAKNGNSASREFGTRTLYSF